MAKAFYFLEYVVGKILGKLRPKMIRNSHVHSSSSVGPGSEFISSKMGRHSYCGADCRIVDTEIGSFCSIANSCAIGLDSHSIDWVSTSPVFNENRDQIKMKYSHFPFATRTFVQVGSDVWIGERVVIKSGVSVGHGSIIGAGSVVTKDIPPYEIWGGVPAKLIRKRFSPEITEGLLVSQWWNLDDNLLTRAAKSIRSPVDFLKVLNEK